MIPLFPYHLHKYYVVESYVLYFCYNTQTPLLIANSITITISDSLYFHWYILSHQSKPRRFHTAITTNKSLHKKHIYKVVIVFMVSCSQRSWLKTNFSDYIFCNCLQKNIFINRVHSKHPVGNWAFIRKINYVWYKLRSIQNNKKKKILRTKVAITLFHGECLHIFNKI